ncbi:hypothetical protein ACFWYW_46660 [Nonomuraea sp. NPDC059023]|uniref:hypothetical protein n=1 Tax=unclassified Nonomuraea TaxID=2593643 RepID=UPI003684E33A
MLDAARTWELCAPRLGARDTVKVARSGKARGFGGWLELPLNRRLPAFTAAVFIYHHDMTRLLVGDFDPKTASAAGAADPVAFVEAEAADMAALIAACGGDCFTDVNPVTGGRHVYVLWKRKLYYPEMLPIVEALAKRYQSFDPKPMKNRKVGLVIPPGAWVATDEFRRLTDEPAYVDWVLDNPCGPHVWDALMDALTPELEALEADQERAVEIAAAGVASAVPLSGGQLAEAGQSAAWTVRDDERGVKWLPRPGGRLPALSPRMEHIARTGQYRQGKGPGEYVSNSDARQAVIAGAVSCGWQLADVTARLTSGRWPGLADFYSRYRDEQGRIDALRNDWENAAHHLAGRELGREIHTRGKTHGGATELLLAGLPVQVKHPTSPMEPTAALRETRRWHSAFEAAARKRWTGAHGITLRRVLAAALKAAQLARSMVIGFGVRELALLSCLDYSTVAKALRELREERDPFLVLVLESWQERADIYQLVIPDAYAEAAAWRRWQPGKLGGIHPVFRELGGPAALVYERLSSEPTRKTDLPLLTGVASTACGTALRRLAEEGLAVRAPEGWVRGPADPTDVAERLGVYEEIKRIKKRYAEDRNLWRKWLEILEVLAPEFDREDWSFPPEVMETLGTPDWLITEPTGPPDPGGFLNAPARIAAAGIEDVFDTGLRSGDA